MPFDLLLGLMLSTILFVIGVWGICFTVENLILILISIELLLLSINLNFIIFSVYLDDILGQMFALFVLTVAAAESAIGLAILVVIYRIRGIIALDSINLIKG